MAGLVDDGAERALQPQSFGGEGGQRLLLARDVDSINPSIHQSTSRASESSSATARSLLLGFSMAYSTGSQSSNVRWVCCWREVISIRPRKVADRFGTAGPGATVSIFLSGHWRVLHACSTCERGRKVVTNLVLTPFWPQLARRTFLVTLYDALIHFSEFGGAQC